MWGKGGKAREGHEETSREVACSEDVRLEVRVFHELHREVIVRQKLAQNALLSNSHKTP